MVCPSLEELLLSTRGMLEPGAKTEIQRHVSAGCRHCEENLRWLGQILAVTALDDSFEFPEHLIQWSVAQFKVASGFGKPRSRFLAKLIFDSLRSPQTVELRSTEAPPAGSRQTLFQAGSYDIDLRFEPAAGFSTLLIIGQIVNAERPPADLAGLTVRLAPRESAVPQNEEQTQTDSRGIFRLRGIPAGEYDLVIQVPEGDLFIDAITCRAE